MRGWNRAWNLVVYKCKKRIRWGVWVIVFPTLVWWSCLTGIEANASLFLWKPWGSKMANRGPLRLGLDSFFLLVLKHGSRSLKIWWGKMSKIIYRNESEKKFESFLGRCPYKRIIFLIPDNWWSFLELADDAWYAFEGLDRCWRANHSCNLRKGAKDSSNQLVAGSNWNVPENSGPMFAIHVL